MNFPVIIGAFVDYSLLDSRYVMINLIWMMFFSIPSIVFKTSKPIKLGAIIFFGTGLIETCHWILIRGPVTVVSILTIGGTNYQESLEFLSLKSSLSLLALIPYFFLLGYTLRKQRTYLVYKGKSVAVIGISLVTIIFISENALNGRLVRKGLPQFYKVCLSFSSQYGFYKQTEINRAPHKVEAIDPDSNSKIFLLIIGESLNRHHMSLYNYHRKTTPLLDSRDDILVFNDVVSAYSNTINSVLSILSEANIDNGMHQESSVDVFDIFSSAGFKTFWLSNQSPYGVWENKITSLAKKSDAYKFVNLASNSSMEATLTASYDYKIFAPFGKILDDSHPKKLIIVHLMGNHTSYKKRYPNNFEVFNGVSKHEQVIAEYDNSVLYNDFITDSLLSAFSVYSTVHKKVSSAIYLSDHGENVYDEDNQVGHSYTGKLPKANVDVPFLVWLSDEYKLNNPIKFAQIKNNLQKPFVTDDLFHAILDINNIETEYFKNRRSLFQPDFNDNKKRILVDGKDYDAPQ